MTAESETNAIIREIDATRDDIRQTLDELGNRLSVANLLDSAVKPATQGTAEFARSVGTAAQHNPLGLVVTAVGLAWLMFSQRSTARVASAAGEGGGYDVHRLDPNRPPQRNLSPEGPSMTDKISETMESAKDWSQEKMHKATETMETAKGWSRETAHKAAEVAHKASEKAHHLADSASRTTMHVADRASRTTKEIASRAADTLQPVARSASGFVSRHPLAVGAAVIGAGALLAFTLARGRGEGGAREVSKPERRETETTPPEAVLPSTAYPTETDRERVREAATELSEFQAEEARAADTQPEPPGKVRVIKPSPMGVLGQKIEEVPEASLAVGAEPVATEATEGGPEKTETAKQSPGKAAGKQSTGGAQAPIPSGKTGTTTDSRPEKVTSTT